jgi:hypothetical protein
VVRFCSREGLPIDAWLITGLWRMPARVEHVARWICALATDAGEVSGTGEAAIWIDTGLPGAEGRMPERFERRLVGHLRREGCRVCGTRLFSGRTPL